MGEGGGRGSIRAQQEIVVAELDDRKQENRCAVYMNTCMPTYMREWSVLAHRAFVVIRKGLRS